MKQGKRDRFTPNGIDCYFVTVMTDNRFKQQCRDDLICFVARTILLFTPEQSDFALLSPSLPRVCSFLACSLYDNFS